MAAFITLKMLEEKKVCARQIYLFKKHFGDSVEVTVESMLSVADIFEWTSAAEKLLDAPALENYKAVATAALKAYEAVDEEAFDAYYSDEAREAVDEAWDVYNAAKATAFAKAFINQTGI